MTAPGGTFAEANVKATLTWDDIERLMTPRVEAEMKRAEKAVQKHLNNIEASFGRAADRMADAFAHGMSQAARTVDRELAGIERRLRSSKLAVTVDVKIDSAAVERQLASKDLSGAGAAQGGKFASGFVGALGLGLAGISSIFSGGLKGAESSFAGIALKAKVAAFGAKQLGKALAGASIAAGVLAGQGFMKLAAGLKLAARFAGQLARDLGRVIALATVLQALGRGLGALANFGKMAAIGTMGFATLLGAATGVANLLSGPMMQALTAVGAAMGVAAGAAAGILGPALVALKVGFKGLADGAKEFNKQFEAMDDALNARIGNMMAPLLTAWHDASSQMKLAFASALQPAFKSMGGLVNDFRPQLVGLSTTLGQVGNDVAKSLAGPAAKQGFADMLAASNTFFSAFKGESGLGGLSAGLVSFAGTAAKTFAGTGKGINEALLSAGEWLRNISPEQMTAAMDKVRQVFSNIAAVAGPVIRALMQLGSISAPALAPGFQAIGQAISQATPGIMQMARELMPALGQVMQNLAPILPSIVNSFTPWASVVAVIAPHIATLVSHLGPLAPLILGIALAATTITKAMVAYNAVMAIASIGQGVFAAATGAGTASLTGNTIALAAHKVATLAGTVATKAATAATRVFNAVLRMNPIGLIITAITALVGGLTWFFTQTEMGKRVWTTAWNAIKGAVSAVVEWFTGTAVPWLSSAWESIKSGALTAWNAIKGAIGAAWEGIKIAIAVAIAIIKAYITGWIAVIKGIGAVFTWLWQNVVIPVWEGIKTAIQVAIAVISAMIEGFKAIWTGIQTVLMWLWNNVFVPVWDGIKATLQAAWDGIKAIIDAGLAVFQGIQTVLMWVWQSVVIPIWEGIKQAFSNAIDGVMIVWDRMVTGAERIWTLVRDKFTMMVDFVKGIPAKIASTASGMWDGISNAFKATVNSMIRVWNSFASGLSFTTPDWVPGVGGKSFSIPTIAEFAMGGHTGPGAKNKVAGVVHADEFVLSKAARGSIEGKFPGLLDFMNRFGTLPGYDTGGLVSGLRSAVSGIVNSGYVWGGWGNGWNTDCSGATSSVANIATGKASGPGQGERTATGGMGQFLAARGFQAGRGPNGSLRIGWSSSHAAGTLPDGTNFEHTGPQGTPGKFGAGAQGADKFPNEMFLPMGGDPSGAAGPVVGGSVPATSLGSGGGGSSSSTGGSSGGGASTTGGGSTSGGGRKLTVQEELAKIPMAALESAFGIKIPSWLDPFAEQTAQGTVATAANTQAVQQNTQAITGQQTSSGQPAVPLATPQPTVQTAAPTQAPAGAATVPLTQNPDGTWGSSNPEWNKLIKRESGGKPKIVQGIQDANSGGNEASGLFQIAKGTWKGSGGTAFAPTAGEATPEQQAQIAAKIFNKSGGSPWGAGIAGRESEAGLRAGIVPAGGQGGTTPVPAIAQQLPFQQTPTPTVGTPGPAAPLPITPTPGTPIGATPTMNTTDGKSDAPALITGDTGTTNNTGGDLITGGIGWAGDATKEIVGQFLAPFGLDGLFGKGVDIGTNAAKGAAAQAQKAAQAGVQAAGAAGAATGNPALVGAGAVAGGATAVFNQQITTADPKEQTRQSVRAVGEGMTPITNYLRTP